MFCNFASVNNICVGSQPALNTNMHGVALSISFSISDNCVALLVMYSSPILKFTNCVTPNTVLDSLKARINNKRCTLFHSIGTPPSEPPCSSTSPVFSAFSASPSLSFFLWIYTGGMVKCGSEDCNHCIHSVILFVIFSHKPFIPVILSFIVHNASHCKGPMLVTLASGNGLVYCCRLRSTIPAPLINNTHSFSSILPSATMIPLQIIKANVIRCLSNKPRQMF